MAAAIHAFEARRAAHAQPDAARLPAWRAAGLREAHLDRAGGPA